MIEYIEDFEENTLKSFLDKKNIIYEKAYNLFYLSFKSVDGMYSFKYSFGKYEIIKNVYNESLYNFIADFNYLSNSFFTNQDKKKLTDIVFYLTNNLNSIKIKIYNPFIS